MKEIIQLLHVFLFLSVEERVFSLPTKSTLTSEDYPTTFHTAELLISPKQNARILEPSSTFFIVPTSTLENALSDNSSFKKQDHESQFQNLSSFQEELQSTTPIYVPETQTTFKAITTTETEYETTFTSVPDHITTEELTELNKETTTLSLIHEELQNDTALPMVYSEVIVATELVPQEEVYISTTTVNNKSTTTTMTTTSTTVTVASTRKIKTTTFPTTTTTQIPVNKDDPLLYGYQNDPHWDPSIDFSDYQEEIEQKKDKSKLNKIQLMDEGVKDSMTIVLTPINYVRDAMVHIKYKRISKDPTQEVNQDPEDAETFEMTTDVSFPLLNEENRRNLENLPEGWYFICAEVTKFDKMLEQECFRARIFEKASPHLETGIIVLIVLAMIIIVLLGMYIVYNKLQNFRRKKKDKEMQDRIDKMAQKERELNERNKPAFNHIYVDPDEPYEERCIM